VTWGSSAQTVRSPRIPTPQKHVIPALSCRLRILALALCPFRTKTSSFTVFSTHFAAMATDDLSFGMTTPKIEQSLRGPTRYRRIGEDFMLVYRHFSPRWGLRSMLCKERVASLSVLACGTTAYCDKACTYRCASQYPSVLANWPAAARESMRCHIAK
jgi:hypothetical protein